MKILFAVSVFDIGGAEVLALELTQKLHERGHEIILYAANEKVFNKELAAKYSPYIKARYSLANWSVVNFATHKLNAIFRRLGFGDSVSKRVRSYHLRSVIKAEKVDLVCSHSPRSDAICKEAMKGLDVPLIIVEHGIYSHYLHSGKKQLLAPLSAATEIIAVSDFCNQQIKSHMGNSAAVTTISNGVDVVPTNARAQIRSELGIKDGDIVFGLAARGVAKKGWEPAIEAFLKLKSETDKRIHLVLIGGSRYVDKLKARFKDQKEIHFIGKVSHPVGYIEAVDVGLMLSMYKTEALSLVAIEFLKLGKPVIATNVGGVPEVFQFKGDTPCQLIDLEGDGTINTEELKNVMLGFVNHKSSLVLDPVQMEPVFKKFSMETCAQSYETFFNRIVSNHTNNQSTTNRVQHRPFALQGKKAKHTELLEF